MSRMPESRDDPIVDIVVPGIWVGVPTEGVRHIVIDTSATFDDLQHSWLFTCKGEDEHENEYEMLVLATRDCIQVSQSSQFGNIEVRAKDKLWENQQDPIEPSATE